MSTRHVKWQHTRRYLPTKAFGEEIEDKEGVYPAITISGSKIDREFSFDEIGQ